MSDKVCPIIYNLFPSLVGDVSKWRPHVDRAVSMHFNWIFLNPIHLTGASGSLYSIRDYFNFSPIFFPQGGFTEQVAALSDFCEYCKGQGVGVMADLVINHTAYDNPLTQTHRQWYKLNDDGSIKNPGAVDNSAPGGYVTWGDLSEIDNANSSDREALHEYWWQLVKMFLDAGVRGFRCDAAYHVPTDLWRKLIQRSHEVVDDVQFFAESLGCSMEETLGLADCGFDYVFNSGKWWDYRESWFLDQMKQICGRTHSICFPESHDTERLASEWNGDIHRIKQHYLMSALVGAGVMIPLGFEYGFRKKPHVVHSNPLDYEGAHFDLTDFLRQVNRIKLDHPVFHEDNRLDSIDTGHGEVLGLRKSTFDNRQSVVMLFNRTGNDHVVRLDKLRGQLGGARLHTAGQGAEIRLHGWGVVILQVEN